MYASTFISTYLAHLTQTYPPTNPSVDRDTSFPAHLTSHKPILLPTYPPTAPPTSQSANLPACLLIPPAQK